MAAIKNGKLAPSHLPAVSFLKAPGYQDAHADYSDPIDEQEFVVNEINSLEALPTWSSTAVVIAYDDSDGWYDHVYSGVTNPSQTTSDVLTGTNQCGTGTTYLFNEQGRCGYGPRLPLMVVSPYAKSNFVSNTLTDQSSIINFVDQNWALGQIPGSAANIAGSLDGMFNFSPGAAKTPALILCAEDRPADLPDFGHAQSGSGAGIRGNVGQDQRHQLFHSARRHARQVWQPGRTHGDVFVNHHLRRRHAEVVDRRSGGSDRHRQRNKGGRRRHSFHVPHVNRRGTVIAALVAIASLAGCAGSGRPAASTPSTPPAGAAVITAAACAPGWQPPRSGRRLLAVENQTRATYSVDLLGADQTTVYGEIEVLGPGTTATMDVVLPPGRYSLECESIAGSSTFSEVRTVTGPPVPGARPFVPVDFSQIQLATLHYRSELTTRLGQLASDTDALDRALKSGECRPRQTVVVGRPSRLRPPGCRLRYLR